MFRHLVRNLSDHHPILISSSKTLHTHSRDFATLRIQDMWFRHHTFKLLSWTYGLGDSKTFRHAFYYFPHNCVRGTSRFGNIFYRKAWCIARLEGIQRGLCVKSSAILEELEGKVIDELNELLIREHIYWKQKAGIRWIQGGEQNTKYFHQSMLVRRCTKQDSVASG